MTFLSLQMLLTSGSIELSDVLFGAKLANLQIAFTLISPVGLVRIKGIVILGMTGFALVASPLTSCKSDGVATGGTVATSISNDALFLNFSSSVSTRGSRLSCSLDMVIPPASPTTRGRLATISAYSDTGTIIASVSVRANVIYRDIMLNAAVSFDSKLVVGRTSTASLTFTLAEWSGEILTKTISLHAMTGFALARDASASCTYTSVHFSGTLPFGGIALPSMSNDILELTLSTAAASFEGSVSCYITGVLAPMVPAAARFVEIGTCDPSNVGTGHSSVLIPPVFASEFVFSNAELSDVYAAAVSSLTFFIKPSNESAILSITKIEVTGLTGFSLDPGATASCRLFGLWQGSVPIGGLITISLDGSTMSLMFSKTLSSRSGTGIKCEASGLINPTITAHPRCIAFETYDVLNTGMEFSTCDEIQGIVTNELHFASLLWPDGFALPSTAAPLVVSFASNLLTNIQSIHISGLLLSSFTSSSVSCTNLVGSPAITASWIPRVGTAFYGGSVHLSFSAAEQVADERDPVVCTISSFNVGPSPMGASATAQVYVYSSSTSLAFYLKDVVFPAIVAGLGANSPVVSLSNQLAGATNVVMRVSLTPEMFLREARSFVVTLAGAGLSCSGGCPVAFTSPTNPLLTASAAISGTQVVTVTLSSAHTFPGMEMISFDISGVSNPSASQAELRGVRAAVLNLAGSVLGSSNNGTMCPVFKGSLQNASVVLSGSTVAVKTKSMLAQWDYSVFSLVSFSNDPAPVFFSISFCAATLGSIRFISVAGMEFTQFVSPPSTSNCSFQNSVIPASIQFSKSTQNIAIVLSQDLNVNAIPSLIHCFVGFFINSQTRKSGNVASISTLNALNQPLDINSKVPYSDRFQGQLSNVSFSLSSVVSREKAVLSISFYPSSLAHLIKSVSVIGIEFSQFLPENVDCYLELKKISANTSYNITSQTLCITLSQSIQVLTYTVFACRIAGFSNPTRALKARDAFVATYDSDSLPLDIGTFKSPAIFSGKAQFLNTSFSSYAESSISTLTFHLALSEGLSSYAVSFINLTSNMIAGVSDGFAVCNNVNHTGLSVISSASRISIFVNGSAVIVNDSAPISCQIDGVIIAPYQGLYQGLVNLETFDLSMIPLNFISLASFGVTCKPGHFAVDGACRPCVAGTYCNSNCSLASPCTVCPAGFFSVIASSSCIPCHAGSYTASAGKSACDVCPSGSTSATGSIVCLFAAAFYTAASWNSSNPSILIDLSPNRQHLVDITGGNFSLATPIDEMPYFSGSSTTKIKFPSHMISGNFTLIYMARFDGLTMRNIFQACSTPSWVSAFYEGKSGISSRPNCGIITEPTDIHGSDWTVVTEQAALVRTNGVQRSRMNISECLTVQDTLCINFNESYSSDFAIQTFMWFNETLDIDQIVVLEALLMTQRRFWTPNRMQVLFRCHYPTIQRPHFLHYHSLSISLAYCYFRVYPRSTTRETRGRVLVAAIGARKAAFLELSMATAQTSFLGPYQCIVLASTAIIPQALMPIRSYFELPRCQIAARTIFSCIWRPTLLQDCALCLSFAILYTIAIYRSCTTSALAPILRSISLWFLMETESRRFFSTAFSNPLPQQFPVHVQAKLLCTSAAALTTAPRAASTGLWFI